MTWRHSPNPALAWLRAAGPRDTGCRRSGSFRYRIPIRRSTVTRRLARRSGSALGIRQELGAIRGRPPWTGRRWVSGGSVPGSPWTGAEAPAGTQAAAAVPAGSQGGTLGADRGGAAGGCRWGRLVAAVRPAAYRGAGGSQAAAADPALDYRPCPRAPRQAGAAVQRRAASARAARDNEPAHEGCHRDDRGRRRRDADPSAGRPARAGLSSAGRRDPRRGHSITPAGPAMPRAQAERTLPQWLCTAIEAA